MGTATSSRTAVFAGAHTTTRADIPRLLKHTQHFIPGVLKDTTHFVPNNCLVKAFQARRRLLVRHPNSIRANTNQGQDQGSILSPPRTAALPKFDVGSDGVRPT